MENLEFLDTYADFVKQDLLEKLNKGTISIAEHDKGLVSLAYEYFLHGYIENGLMVLSEVQDRYFDYDMVVHLMDDVFKIKCLFIFDILDWKGYIPFDILSTQKGGNA